MNFKHCSFPSFYFFVLFLRARECVCTRGGGGGGSGLWWWWAVGGSESICCGRVLPFRPMKVINELQKIINQSANWVAGTRPLPHSLFAARFPSSILEYLS